MPPRSKAPPTKPLNLNKAAASKGDAERLAPRSFRVVRTPAPPAVLEDVIAEGPESEHVLLEEVADMIKLEELSDATILKTLQARHAAQKVYTYISDIVISVNPFCRVDGESATGDAQIRLYANGPKGPDGTQLPPHLYALVQRAIVDLRSCRADQAILISGESGAGKTEATKVCLEYLTRAPIGAGGGGGGGGGGKSKTAFMEASPVLEALGNAKTVRSRAAAPASSSLSSSSSFSSSSFSSSSSSSSSSSCALSPPNMAY